MDVYNTPQFNNMRSNAIGQDLSWRAPARKWEAVIELMYSPSGTSSAKKGSVQTPVAAAAGKN